MGFADLLRRGLAAGAAAGSAAAVVLYLLVEPVIRRALVIEDARGTEAADGHDHSHGAEGAEPLVSRAEQVIGGMVTAVVIGCLFGIVFAVVFAKVRHRLPASTDLGRSAVLAGLGFLAFVLVPALEIPSNPPAVGDPGTVTHRTLIYVLTIVLTVALVLALFALDQLLRGRALSAPARTSIVAVAFAAGATLLLVVLPGTPDAIPEDVPAALIWDFRLASLAQLATMWATLGLVFGALATPRVKSTREAEAIAA